MRLICPKCQAQYEVPAHVIPDDGREVKCSNCDATWFQPHPHASEPGDDAPTAPSEPAANADAPEPPREPGQAEVREAERPREPEQTPAASRPPADEAAPPEPVRARRLDPAVAEVLRAEAERESRQRARPGPAEARGVSEHEPAFRARAPRGGTANLRGEPTGDATPAPTEDAGGRKDYDLGDSGPTPAETASRRTLLPDVNEINQSLRPAERQRPDERPLTRGRAAERERQGGFFRGFVTILVLGLLLLGIYLAAPQIARAVPSLADPLALYVEAVDAARIWLDARLTSLFAWLNGTTSGT